MSAPAGGGRAGEDAVRRLLADPPDLPVRHGLDALRSALGERGAAVLQAPPGSGKTTLVPPVLADLLGPGGGRVVVTQPRRIAARAAARRLAHLLGEPVGRSVGYVVRGERVVGPETRVEVVTTGILLRRLQRDPDLPGVGAVVLDEVHERALDADLALALTVDVRSALRPDLLLVAMSATVEAERTAAALSGGEEPVAVVDVPGALHPVERRWVPLPGGVKRLDDRGTTPAFLDYVAATARAALARDPGDLLVFLPGAGEVDGVVRRLRGTVAADVHPLHGRLPSAEQDRALAPAAPGERRVVVSTAVAESSLTVPGVRLVVDAGLSREPRTDHRRGLAGLVTVRVSRAGADQRAGRAGREGPGVVHRCWSESEEPHLPAHPEPEVVTADLTGFALELAVWGAPDGAGLALLDAPPAPALAAARAVLADLGAVEAPEDGGAVTARGRALAQVPTDPRLARALLDGAPLVGARRAAEVVALLAEDVRAPGADLVAALRAVRRGGPGTASWKATARRLEGLVGGAGAPSERLTDDVAVGLVVALAHPDRVARRRPGGTSYLTVGGTGAALPRAGDRDAGTTGSGSSGLGALEWLAVADLDRRPGAGDATVRAAAPLTEDLALEAAAARWQETDDVGWRGDRVTARRVTRLGAIELSSAPLSTLPPGALATAWRERLGREGLDALPWGEAARSLRRRLDFLHRTLGDPWPDVSDAGLAATAERWLGADPRRTDLVAALRGLLPWPEAGRVDELAPERVRVPSGSSVRVDYAGDQPVLAVRLQEVLGWEASPLLADGRVPLLLHLLSPAQRPLAVTADLRSFWDDVYPQVRAEMRGRYPRHPWPEDPWTAPPTRRAAPRRPRP